YLVNGVIVRKERETNFDNKIDTWDYYEGGRLVRRERDSDGDGIVDQWWTFNNPANPKCAIVASDRNGDRKPDPDSVVDLCAESYGTPKGTPSATPSSAPAASSAATTPAPPATGTVAGPGPSIGSSPTASG